MTRRHGLLAAAAAAGTAVALVWLAAAPTGQAPAAADQGWTPNILPDGQPDMQGIYINPWPFPIENYTEEEREEFRQVMIAHRGPDTGAYDFEWLEQSVTERREDWPYPDGFYPDGSASPTRRARAFRGRTGRSPRRSTSRYRVFIRAPEDYVLFEYACHEGNRTMELTFGDSSCSSTRATRGTGRWS